MGVVQSSTSSVTHPTTTSLHSTTTSTFPATKSTFVSTSASTKGPTTLSTTTKSLLSTISTTPLSISTNTRSIPSTSLSLTTSLGTSSRSSTATGQGTSNTPTSNTSDRTALSTIATGGMPTSSTTHAPSSSKISSSTITPSSSSMSSTSTMLLSSTGAQGTSASVTSTISSTSSSVSSVTPSSNANPSRYLMIMGDSYTATGFDMSGFMPSVDVPLGNPAYPGVTYSGGINWVDVLVYNHSQVGTVAYNWAQGGNCVNATLMGCYADYGGGKPADMSQQMNLMRSVQRSKSFAWNSTNSIWINWFGINDLNSVAGAYNSNISLVDAMNARIADDVTEYYMQLEQQYQLGARRFLSILLPPINRFPIWVGSDSATLFTKLVSTWNTAMKNAGASFQQPHGDAALLFYDPAPLFNTMLDNYASYGASSATCNSYPNGQPCLWNDGYGHPGLAINKQLGSQISGIVNGMW